MRITILSLALVFSQISLSQEELDISFWSDVMMNANEASHRSYAAKQFQLLFDEMAENEELWNFDFDRTPELAVIADSLNTFKIISWQIAEGDAHFSYYGYLIKEGGEIYELEDQFASMEDLEFIQLDPKMWLGGIYYNLIEEDGRYFLFSYRQLDEFTKFKSFDCLSFDSNGIPTLGAELFVVPSKDSRDIIKNRVAFFYSSDAILSLNYNPSMNMVVHDHLMQVIGQREGQGPTYVPDGTYEGWMYKEGKWVYEEKLFFHTYDEAPRPEQILGNSDKNIFGKDKKNK